MNAPPGSSGEPIHSAMATRDVITLDISKLRSQSKPYLAPAKASPSVSNRKSAARTIRSPARISKL